MVSYSEGEKNKIFPDSKYVVTDSLDKRELGQQKQKVICVRFWLRSFVVYSVADGYWRGYPGCEAQEEESEK